MSCGLVGDRGKEYIYSYDTEGKQDIFGGEKSVLGLVLFN